MSEQWHLGILSVVDKRPRDSCTSFFLPDGFCVNGKLAKRMSKECVYPVKRIHGESMAVVCLYSVRLSYFYRTFCTTKAEKGEEKNAFVNSVHRVTTNNIHGIRIQQLASSFVRTR